LHTDRPRPAVSAFVGATHKFEVPPTLAGALLTLSQRAEVTMFMTLLAAFQALLHRYTGQEDIVVGAPIAGRNRTDLEGLIGFFVNTLVLRADLGGPHLSRVAPARAVDGARCLSHQDLPFERLVEELQPSATWEESSP
jgi:non-ribosomal peptide synthetase component F